MKAVTLALAATLIGSAAFAQTTTIIREKPADETTVIKRETMGGTVVKKVETTGSVGCETKSVTKTNDMGDTVKKTKTDC